jgi:hypothetical protein
MLGDNPMQSEFACHIGFRGRFFCRVCWVKGVPDEDEDEDGERGNGGNVSDASSASGASSTSGVSTPQPQGQTRKQGKKKKKVDESVFDMISRVTQFVSVSPDIYSDIYNSTCSEQKATPRNREESVVELRSQFLAASVVGGQASFKRRKTDSGIKDTLQGAFLERVFAVSTRKKRTKVQKQADISTVLRTFPKDITSPVWRIKGRMF